MTLSSSLSAALFSNISLFLPLKLLCAIFNPIPASYPILTLPSQASVYDRGLRTGSRGRQGLYGKCVTRFTYLRNPGDEPPAVRLLVIIVGLHFKTLGQKMVTK